MAVDATAPFGGVFQAGAEGTVHSLVARAVDLGGNVGEARAVTVVAGAASPGPGGPGTPATGKVKTHRKISSTEGGFAGALDNSDLLGYSVTSLGDLDGDSVADLAVGAPLDDDGGSDQGAVWILFLNADGTVKSHQKISSTEGNFSGVLDPSDWFGVSASSLGDLDGDGVVDLAVGAYFDDDGDVQSGAVWILFLNADGTVKAHQKISSTEGDFTGDLDRSDQFGFTVSPLGDLDGDGAVDLAVGAIFDSDGGFARGAVWILFLNADGTVKAHQKISNTEGDFTGALTDLDQFGYSAAPLGDLDGDGALDLAVGARFDFGSDLGAVWILFLNPDGTVKAHQKISSTEGGFTGTLNPGDLFGVATAAGFIDGDSVIDLAVGAVDNDGGTNSGAVWILFLNLDGTVKAHQKISSTEGDFTGDLDAGDFFAAALTPLGDLDGDGVIDFAAGALGDDDGGNNRGAVWILFLEAEP